MIPNNVIKAAQDKIEPLVKILAWNTTPGETLTFNFEEATVTIKF